MSISVVLADDHQLMRDGLRSVLEEDYGHTVVAQAGDGAEAVSRTRDLQPDVVIMDMHMPVLNGIDATREIRSCCNAKVIALSMERDPKRIYDMFQAGAHAYILKHSALEELECAIRAVLAGRRYLGKDLSDKEIESYLRDLEVCETSFGTALTPKERIILQLIAEGYSTKEIAARLCVTVSTIETHRNHLYSKVGEPSVAGLTKVAIRMGLTEV